MRFFKILMVNVGLLFGLDAYAQPAPKQEMRAAWVTTVWGLDWPATKIPYTGSEYHINQQKSQMIALLDALKSANMNTIFFQVRSECDAMYQSSYEPWSAHLVEERGMDPGYDPLQFVIDEGHKRGLEVHAWLNPYRFESVAGKYEGEAGDYRQTHPEWVLEYSGGSAILDPGNPGVRQRIADIVEEVVTHYNIDGVVFDDYFYAYGGTPLSLDAYSQNLWKPSGMSVHDWRRDNVNQMVADVYNRIQGIKPWVTFGLSPFGIWTTDPAVAASRGIELPAGITGLDAYHSIYCDPVAWLEQGTVDYVSPQIYWPTTSTGQDYEVLSPWWSEVCNRFGRHLYVSHSLSDLAASDYMPGQESLLKSISQDSLTIDLKGLSLLEYFSQPSLYRLKASTPPTEYGLQVQINRLFDKNGAPGSVFFRASMFYREGFINYLTSHEYENRALPPAINWKGITPRALPDNLRLEGDVFKWDSGEENVRFVVYAVPNATVNEPGNFTGGDHLLGVSYSGEFSLEEHPDIATTHHLAVSVLDRFGNEFPPVIMNIPGASNEPAALIYPADQQEVYNPFLFQWQPVSGAELYILEVASDAAFQEMVYRRELADVEFTAVNVAMDLNQSYYWRVFVRKPGVQDVASTARSFTLVDQPRPQITKPVNNATGVSLTPVIEWTSFGEGFTYDLQISRNASFSVLVVEESGLNALSYHVPEEVLTAFSTYYVRLLARDAQSVTAWSATVQFSTLETPPSVPVIVSPTEGSDVPGPDVTFEIMEEPLARSFTWLVSSNPDFPILSRKQKTVDAFNYQVQYTDLTPGTWYVKVRANYGVSSSTDYSATVSFNIVPVSVNETPEHALMLRVFNLFQGDVATVKYQIPKPSPVRLFLSDMTGRTLRVLVDENRSAGEFTVSLPLTGLQRGMYFLTLETPEGRKTVKLIK